MSSVPEGNQLPSQFKTFTFSTVMGKKLSITVQPEDTHEIVNRKIEEADDYMILDSFDSTKSPCNKIGLKPHEKDMLYDMLERFDRLMTQHDIRYYATGGTALGAIRHGEIIPWDDDADVSMERVFFNKARALFPQEGLKWAENERFGARISYEPSQAEESGNLGDVTFLTIDIFVIETTIDGFTLAYPEAKKNWPREIITREEMYPIRRVPFGPITIPVVAQTEAYLSRQYGPDWREWGYFPMVLHRTMHYIGKVKIRLNQG